MHTPIVKSRDDWRYYLSMPANLDKVNGSENEDNTHNGHHDQHGRLLQVDSGHLTSGSHQSLHKQRSSESDYDFMRSGDYDADDESDHCLTDCFDDPVSDIYHAHLPIEQALNILMSRPKISERIMANDDTDDEFHESEYDVIESHDEDDDKAAKRKTSSSKKKMTRSLSDVKLRRKTSRASLRDMKEQTSVRNRIQSMPNIQLTPPKPKRGYGTEFRPLSSHREDEELNKISAMSVDEFTTSSSLSKYKSDEADESFVPNSEMDYYSTWNSPGKIKNGNIDSSEIEASFEIPKTLKPPPVSRNLLKELMFKREQRTRKELPPLVSGRFRVSVIREEENSSRRGSASSTELTLRRSPGLARMNFGKRSSINSVTPETPETPESPKTPINDYKTPDNSLCIIDVVSPTDVPKIMVDLFSKKDNISVISDLIGPDLSADFDFTKRLESSSDPHDTCLPMDHNGTYENEFCDKEHHVNTTQLAKNIDSLDNTLVPITQDLYCESNNNPNDSQLAKEQNIVSETQMTEVSNCEVEISGSVPFTEVPSLASLAETVLDDTKKSNIRYIECPREIKPIERKTWEGLSIFFGDVESEPSASGEQSSLVDQETEETKSAVTAGVNLCRSKTEAEIVNLQRRSTSFSVIDESPHSDKLLKVLNMNGNIYSDSSIVKLRAVSPTTAVLKTYDVIQDVPCNVEDYDILGEDREGP